MFKYYKTFQAIEWGTVFEELGSTMVISIDTETSGLDPFSSEWILLQVKLNESIFIFDARTLERKHLSYIIELLNSSGKPILAHNAKFDSKFIYKGSGIWLQNLHDVMLVESFIYRGVGKVFYSLQDLVAKYTGEILEKDTRDSFINFTGELSQEQLSYSAKDVLYLERIYEEHLKLIKERGLELTIKLEMDLVPVVAQMELNGAFVDKEDWLALEKIARADRGIAHEKILDIIINKIDFSKYKNGLELAQAFNIPVKTKRDKLALEFITDPSNIKDWFRENINLGSPKQLLTILQGPFKLKLESTNEKILKDAKDTEIVPTILEYREYDKKITTYGEKWLENINSVTGRVHSEFLQNGAESGRFSCINPNLQQIPAKRKDTDQDYRQPFRAPEGKKILSMDYEQQEYKLAGSISKEPVIINAYLAGKDMHTATAAILYNKKMEDITKEQRAFGKTLNFAILYGTTEYGLAYNLKIRKEEAKRLLDTFYAGYPTLSKFKKAFEDNVWKLKYSATLLGRRRYWDKQEFFRDAKEAERYEAKLRREGFSHLVQGTGADVTKMAMFKITKENPFGESFKLIIQVHDELVVEVDEKIAKDALDFGIECMTSVFQPYLGKIPASVDGHIADCWSK